MCAVLCRLEASTRCQRRCALAVQVSGFNWALFTWQGTHQRGWWMHAADSGLVLRCCFALCKHSITPFRPKCKLGETTRYCAFQLKIAHFRRFEHNILWWQEKIHTSHKKLHKITAIFQLVFVHNAHESEKRCDDGALSYTVQEGPSDCESCATRHASAQHRSFVVRTVYA